LEISELKDIINSLETKFGFEQNIEITLETTPQNITSENLIGWKSIGINRISIGIQTLNDKSLKEIGRFNNKISLNALNEIKNSKFDNINLDFIIGLPHTKKGEIKENIEFILNNYNFIKHISVYMLEDHYYSFKNSLKDEDYLGEYNEIRNFLEKKGFNFYELSNSSKVGYECKHNKAYWNHSEMLAFGLGAHGFINSKRFSYSSNFSGFYENKIEEEILGENDLFLEKIMFDIRTSGIDKKLIEKLNKKNILEFIKSGFLEIKEDKLILTAKSYTLVDFIIKEII
ncbi:MAG: radical SAM protein, partial [Candidatus Gracilibacteria bacterium]|nr:radical SAM protein [Candidatus Gracilibacteria bacterium]